MHIERYWFPDDVAMIGEFVVAASVLNEPVGTRIAT
jgi:hypothetical protein